jgi:DNA-directed RNA polymerase specialized sigma24 family protein
MLTEQLTTRELLSKLVGRMTTDYALRDDLMQEALIHFWLIEHQRPGQKPSYYLQSCRFHLQHFMAAGRSIDSAKRRAGQVPLHTDEGDDELVTVDPQSEADQTLVGHVCAQEIIDLLSPLLKPREQQILGCLAEGLGPRDIARRLNVSHPAAIKSRRKIAALLTKYGVAPPAPSRHRRSNESIEAAE